MGDPKFLRVILDINFHLNACSLGQDVVELIMPMVERSDRVIDL